MPGCRTIQDYRKFLEGVYNQTQDYWKPREKIDCRMLRDETYKRLIVRREQFYCDRISDGIGKWAFEQFLDPKITNHADTEMCPFCDLFFVSPVYYKPKPREKD